MVAFYLLNHPNKKYHRSYIILFMMNTCHNINGLSYPINLIPIRSAQHEKLNGKQNICLIVIERNSTPEVSPFISFSNLVWKTNLSHAAWQQFRP